MSTLKQTLVESLYVLAFSQCDKAMTCIHAIQNAANECAELVESMAHVIMFAKHKISLKDRDMEAAENSLRALLKLPLTAFDTALNAVKRFVEELDNSHISRDKPTQQSSADMALEFYKILATKYPK